jgi:hypothetical protein
MKSDVMGIVTRISKEDLKELLKETKETLAVDVKINVNTRSFGAIDLWNMQKRHTTSASRVRRWSN